MASKAECGRISPGLQCDEGCQGDVFGITNERQREGRKEG